MASCQLLARPLAVRGWADGVREEGPHGQPHRLDLLDGVTGVLDSFSWGHGGDGGKSIST